MTAPIAIFAYRRPRHVAQLARTLLANPEARDSRVVAFCDGARSTDDEPFVAETRRVLASSGIPRLELVERPRNLGLAANIIDGVGQLTAAHGRVIVLEDDLILSGTFLRYMNAALDRYADEPRVYHVSGYFFPVTPASDAHDALLLPFINSSGWATWARAWKDFDPAATAATRIAKEAGLRRRFDLGGAYGFSRMLEQYLAGRTNSWAIRWYLSVFMQQGLAVYPARSLVENDGFQDDATHSVGPRPRHASAKANDYEVGRFPPPAVDEATFSRVRAMLGASDTLAARAARRLGLYLGRAARRIRGPLRGHEP